ALPGEAGGIARDPDRVGLLDGGGLDGHAVELIEAPVMRGFLLAEEPPQDRDALLHAGHPLGGADAHHLVLERLGRALLVGAAEADDQPPAPAGDTVEARPLLGEEDGMTMNKRSKASHAQAPRRRYRGPR